MSNDSTESSDSVTGSASESTPSTRIPKMTRASRSDTADDTTDKGRARGTGSGASGSSKAKPLSASDFSRASSGRSASTAVIPSVKPAGSTDSTRRKEAADDKTTAASPHGTVADQSVDGKVRSSAPADEKVATSASNGSVSASGRKGGTATFTPARQVNVKSAATSPAATSTTLSTAAPGAGRAATLRLSHVEPWSVTRMAFVISVAMMIVAVVATAIFWLVLEITGIWDQLSGSVTSVLSTNDAPFDVTDYLGFGRLVGLALVVSAINVVVMTVLATIAAHLYNLAAQIIGGLQVTFNSDQD